jgi:hypothetical protein
MSTPPPSIPAPAPEPAGNDAQTGDLVGGFLLSVLIPLIGIVVGIVYISRGGQKRQLGWMYIGVSCATMLIFAALTAAS